MHVARWLSLSASPVSLVVAAVGRSVGGSPGGRTPGPHPEEVSSLRSGFSDTGAIFYRDRIRPAQV